MVPQRVAVAGAELQLLVLASDAAGCIGVDLASGAFVRAHHPGGGSPLRPYDVATCRLGQSDVPDWSRPELVTLAAPPRRAGRLRRRKAERYLRPLLHPPRPPLLGFGASAVPYWTLEGNQPSVTLIEPARLGVVREGRALRCRFAWQGGYHDLPLQDRAIAVVLDRLGRRGYGPAELQRAAGFRPGRLLIAVTPPHRGYCYKAVAAVLPR